MSLKGFGTIWTRDTMIAKGMRVPENKLRVVKIRWGRVLMAEKEEGGLAREPEGAKL